MNALQQHAGFWTGTNGFRFMPFEEFAVGDSDVVVAAEADDWGVSVRYGWVHPEEGAQTGVLLIGSPDEDGVVTASWIDSFHHKPSLAVLTGTMTPDKVALEMEYSGWGWTIELFSEEAQLRMVMCNVIPDGVDGAEPGPYAAMDATWSRVG